LLPNIIWLAANARKVEFLMGEALTSAHEAVSIASEAQYYSEICGNKEVKSYALDTANFTIDARDFADEAYTNAKKANSSKNLGDIRYYMRKSQNASIEARKSADAAVYAATDAYYSCNHNDTVSK